MSKLKPVWGMYERYVLRETRDNPGSVPATYTTEYVKEPQKARIYVEYFAVHKMGERSWIHWQLDHTPTGLKLARADKLKDCVAKIEALLAVDLPWAEPDRDVFAKVCEANRHLKPAWDAALKATAPFEPHQEPKPKVPAAYGTLASAMENLNSYCPYAQAYRSLWEQNHFHYITKKMVEDRIRFEIAEELIDSYPSAQEAYDEIMTYKCNGVRFLMMGTPLNDRACKAIMRWAKAQGIVD